MHLVLGTTVMDQNRIQLAQATAETTVSAPDDTALLQGAEIIITGVSQFAP